MKHLAPQPEFGFTALTFNLAGQSAEDGDRQQRERAQAELDRATAQAKQSGFSYPYLDEETGAIQVSPEPSEHEGEPGLWLVTVRDGFDQRTYTGKFFGKSEQHARLEAQSYYALELDTLSSEIEVLEIKRTF